MIRIEMADDKFNPDADLAFKFDLFQMDDKDLWSYAPTLPKTGRRKTRRVTEMSVAGD